MGQVIEFPARAVRHEQLRAHSAHEQPVLRFFFRGPDGRIERATIHSTFDLNHLDLTDEQREAYCRHIAASVRAVDCDLLEIITLGSMLIEIGEPSAECIAYMEDEQDLVEAHA